MGSRMKIVLMGAAMGVVAGANAQMFINGNFEAGDLSFWNIATTTNGQTASQSVVQYDIDGPGTQPTNFAGRFQVGRITTATATGGIELTQNLNLIGGWQYYFDFDWAVQRTGSTNNAEGGIFSLIVNGTAITTQAAGPVTGTTPIYGHVTGIFTPTTSGSYTIGARIVRPFTPPADMYQYVDNFAVTAIVPEPGTMAVIALGGAFLARRRRKL